jgi:ribonuclease P protein component
MAGTIVSRTPHFALHRIALDAPSSSTGLGSEQGPQALFAVREAWIGALIPKRWAKRAVTRNAIKRQVYTVSQGLEPPLPQAAHVVRLRVAFDRQQFTSATSEALKRAVRGELQDLFTRAAP